MNPTAYILMGLPGSGKTTWRNKHLGDLPVVSTDDFIDQLAAEQGITYDAAFASNIKAAKKRMQEQLVELISFEQSFVWDQTNLSRKKRQSILSKLPKQYVTYLVEVKCDMKDLLERLEHRSKTPGGKTINKHVLQDMMDRYEQPDIQVEPFDFYVEVTST